MRFQDREAILRLLKQSGVFNDKEIHIGLQVFDDSIMHAERGEYFAYCADGENEEVHGYICFGPNTVTDGCFDLYWIAVDNNFKRRGIGRTLLTFMEEQSAKSGARRVYLDTSSTMPYEPARSFYERHGYEPVCVLTDFYRPGDHKIIFMKELEKHAFTNVECAKAGQDSFGY